MATSFDLGRPSSGQNIYNNLNSGIYNTLYITAYKYIFYFILILYSTQRDALYLKIFKSLIKHALDSRHKYASQYEKQCTDRVLVSATIWIFVSLFSVITKRFVQGNLR